MLTIIFTTASCLGFGRFYEKAFRGRYTLNSSASRLRGTTPAGATLILGPEGWLTIGHGHDDALSGLCVAAAGNGPCTLIGLPFGFSCEIKRENSRHLTWIISRNGAVVRTIDITLLGTRTLTVASRAILPNGCCYAEDEVWEKAPAQEGR